MTEDSVLKIREKHAEYCRQWRANNQDRWRAIARKAQRKRNLKKFGLSVDDLNTMLLQQDFACAICQTLDPGGRGDWHPDHCHELDVPRGLLCSRCNLGLGSFKDDPYLLIQAAYYLSQFYHDLVLKLEEGAAA